MNGAIGGEAVVLAQRRAFCMRLLLRSTCAAAAVIAALAISNSVCSADEDIAFSSPTGGIGCHFYAQHLRCDVAGGLVPMPPRPAGCDWNYGSGYFLRTRGRAGVVCATDSARYGKLIVPYGKTFARYGITCSSSIDGMRCTNADRHGFFISRGEAYRF